MPVPTLSEYSPLRSCGIPQAKSTISRARAIEPIASLTTFPCSEVMRRASSSACCSTSCLKRNMTFARRAGGVAAQAGNAWAAAATAASTSPVEASATRFVTCPVAGS
jgi:hypothetical protein